MTPENLEREVDEPRSDLPLDDELPPPDGVEAAAIEVFREFADETVARRLPSEVVESRLNQFRRALERRSSLYIEDLDRMVEDLSRYAYQVVASWFTIMFDAGLPELDEAASTVTDQDIDSMVREIIARAAVGFREDMAGITVWRREEGVDSKRLFLLKCLLHLPDAYQRWLRETSRVSWDEAEEIGADSNVANAALLLRYLDEQVRNQRDRVIYRLRRVGLPGARRRESVFSSEAAAQIVDATKDVLAVAASEWSPEGRDKR